MMSCLPRISVQPETELTSILKATTGPHVPYVFVFFIYFFYQIVLFLLTFFPSFFTSTSHCICASSVMYWPHCGYYPHTYSQRDCIDIPVCLFVCLLLLWSFCSSSADLGCFMLASCFLGFFCPSMSFNIPSLCNFAYNRQMRPDMLESNAF